MRTCLLTIASTTALLSWAAVSSSSAAALLGVDLGTATSPVETGFPFVGMSANTQTFSGLTGISSGSLLVTFTGSNRDRSAPLDSGAFTFGDLDRDLFTGLTLGTTAATFTITGFDPSTSYSIQIWSVDSANNPNAVFTLYDTTAGSNLLGSVTNKAPANPTNNNDFSVTGTVTSDATGKVTIGQTATAGTGAINGFIISTIPEPSAVLSLLGGVGMLLGLGRRRR